MDKAATEYAGTERASKRRRRSPHVDDEEKKDVEIEELDDKQSEDEEMGSEDEEMKSEFTGKYPVGYKFLKVFEYYREEPYLGEVKEHDPPYGYKVYYEEDSDGEHLEEHELASLQPAEEQRKRKNQRAKKARKPKTSSGPRKSRKPAAKRKEPEPSPPSLASTEVTDDSAVAVNEGGRPRRTRAVVNYDEDKSDEDYAFESEDDMPPALEPRGRKAAAKPTAKKSGRGKLKADSEDEYEGEEAASTSEEEAFDSESDEEPPSESDDEDYDKKPRARGKKATKKTAATKKPPSGKKKMYESFEPLNAPTYKELSLEEIHEQKELLDQCGMEGTDDIIDRLVGAQVDKIWKLLQHAAENGDIGSRSNRLELGTACSGTDAPALAFTLVQEQMELRDLEDCFHFSHKFSCENEPFKQAYLARNFDSVLYPDITKLPDDEPRDVYGQPKAIPPFNFFLAGTSCKNFSMLRSKRRLDIEDKGCSGETFLAAVEVLFKEKPEMAIFENVIGAPWAKMREYITGRVKLSDCDSSKAISGNKDKGKELSFVLEEGRIVVDHVPAVYGVRCGAAVSGFLRPDSTKLNTIHWPKGKKGSCTLSDLIKANKISKQLDTIVFETECTYCTQIVKVDTKEYGLPQTRQRTYMFVWRPDEDNVGDDLGEYWKLIVEFLKSPVRHSLSAFVLKDDHDNIRVFREALRGPPGRQKARGILLEPDFWTSSSANLPHNKSARMKLGMEDKARFTTLWEPFGKKHVPLHFWPEYMACNEQRRTDMLDILYASAIRDAEAHDSSFTNHYWNLSQNVTKEKHKTACAGIAGCITPGGDIFLPQEGRPLLGCEKLMIQGIPYFRLALGNETEVQLGDLAGNAMTLTVVSACMVAAVTCKQLRRETLDSGGEAEVILSESCIKDYKKHSAWSEVSSDAQNERILSRTSSSAEALFRELASFSPEAITSSVWCTCETSGSNSQTNQFLQCKVCGVSCCRNCTSTTVGYNLSSHETADVEIPAPEHNLATFQTRLRQILPPSLVFGLDGIKELAGKTTDDECRVACLANPTFNLHRIKRDRRKWVIAYYARDSTRGVIAEFRITVGELSRVDKNSAIGMKGELISFFPALTTPLVYGPLGPCAVVIVRHGDGDKSPIQWEGKTRDTAFSSFKLEGKGLTDSIRVEVGLTDAAADALEEAALKRTNAKHFTAAKERGEERRWVYAENWKTWPKEICLEAKPSPSSTEKAQQTVELMCGTYERARCRQTTNQSALWIKKGSENEPSMYIAIAPNVNRTGPDRAVVSSSIDCDASSILAVLPVNWEPSDALDQASHVVKNVCLKNWVPLAKMECMIPSSEIAVSSPRESPDVLVSVRGLTDDDMEALCRGIATSSGQVQLDVSGGQQTHHTVRMFNALCAAQILKYTADVGLKYDVTPGAPWMTIHPRDQSVPFGCCRHTVPVRPVEEWFYNEERKVWDRRSQPHASRQFYLALQDAPQPFTLWIDKRARTLEVKCFPEVVAHRAAGQLIEGRSGDTRSLASEVSVYFRFSEVFQQSDPTLRRFKVSNCNSEEPTHVRLSSPFELYERQQKVVTKMLAIENQRCDFEEVEISEAEMFGSTGLSAIAKASRKRPICGAVCADSIGAGKTVTSIALILQGLSNARSSRELPNKSGATLIVVPPALIDQWDSEIKKFTSGLNVICVYDFDSLEQKSLRAIIDADAVICPVDILEANGYLRRVIEVANVAGEFQKIPKLPQYSGQIEVSSADGVWIPHSSNDPYAGGNNKHNQGRRDQSAYYTHVYSTAVEELRKQELGSSATGVPLEYFEWERVIVDEIHESLCTSKAEYNKEEYKLFKEKNRRAGRELLGITQKDIRRRPLLFRKSIIGLTGTPLLDSSSRVIELANLMGNTYIVGLSNHWRKLERESCRDIFLHNYLEPKQSREMRKTTNAKCQEYLGVACCRNKVGDEMKDVDLVNHRRVVMMSEDEKKLYLDSQSGIPTSKRSLGIKPEEFDSDAGHDISKFLRQNAKLESRGKELVRICREILSRKGDEQTKILVFTDGEIGAGIAARHFLQDSPGLGCTWLDNDDSVQVKNKKISWYQTRDVTEEDRRRPRVLVLHYAHAAGLNLQTECHDLILFTPLYDGDGGATSDPVSDTSTVLQAIGRVFRPGQTSPKVNVYRIEVQGPNGEECLDGILLRRNTDKDNVEMAINGGE